MKKEDVIALTRELIAFNTVDPPGNGSGLVRFLPGRISIRYQGVHHQDRSQGTA